MIHCFDALLSATLLTFSRMHMSTNSFHRKHTFPVQSRALLGKQMFFVVHIVPVKAFPY